MPLFGLGDGAVWLWLVLVPVSGWLALKSAFLRHRSWRISGYDRYFLIVLLGVFSAIIGGAVAAAIEHQNLPVNSPTAARIWEFPLYNKIESRFDSEIIALFWSAPIGFVFGLIAYALSWPVYALYSLVKNIAKWDMLPIRDHYSEYLSEINGILNFVEEANKRASFVMLTLNNRKVYIGWPQRLSDWKNPDPSKQYLYFLPLWSGFRDPDSLAMEITTDYTDAYRKFAGRDGPTVADDFRTELAELEIVVPVHEIVHAQPFSKNFYEDILRANQKSTRAKKSTRPRNRK